MKLSKIICWYRGHKLFWFRIFGRGISIEHRKRKLFSERYKYKHPLRIGPLFIEYLGNYKRGEKDITKSIKGK